MGFTATKRIITPRKYVDAQNLFFDDLMQRHNLRYNAARDLVDIYLKWIDNNIPVTRYSLIKTNKRYGRNSYMVVGERLNILVEKDLLQTISKCKYIPTEKTISELKKLIG